MHTYVSVYILCKTFSANFMYEHVYMYFNATETNNFQFMLSSIACDMSGKRKQVYHPNSNDRLSFVMMRIAKDRMRRTGDAHCIILRSCHTGSKKLR